MRAVVYAGAGGPEVVQVVEREKPALGPREALIRVHAAGLNRPDTQQRKGLYPPPPGASDIAGLEIAGVVETVAQDVKWPRAGDAVCALVSSGAHAEFCSIPARQCLPVPRGLSFAQGAVLPEVFFTTWNSMILLGRLAEGETLLIQGGTSGVGLAAMQVARYLRNAQVIATAGTEEKLAVCRSYGAALAVSYRGKWDEEIRAFSPRGIDLVLDGQGGSYSNRHLHLLAEDGRLVLLATHEDTISKVDVRLILRRRLTLTGTTLRPRPVEYKGRLADALRAEVWPLIESGKINMPIHASFPLGGIAEAHEMLDSGQHIGKLAIAITDRADEIPA